MSELGLLRMFEADRGALTARLATEDSAGALRCVREYLEELSDRCSSRNGASSSSAAQARHVIESIRSSFGALRALRPPADSERSAAPDPPPRERRSPRFGLLSRAAETIEEGFRSGDPEEPPPDPEVVIELHAEQLLDSLADALAAADRALRVDAPAEQAQPRPPRWSDDSELMNLIHDLVAARARNSPQELLLRVSLLEDDLKLRHEIQTVSYDGGNDEFFEFLDTPDLSDTRVWTRSPALVTGARLIRRGEVRCPTGPRTPADSTFIPPKDPA